MTGLIHVLDVSIAALRSVFLAAAIALAAICAVDWAVRTGRMHPFSAIARWSRRILAPLLKPVERSVVRAGGNPVSAPWWTLIAMIIIGIVVLQTLDFLRGQVATVSAAFDFGPRGIAHVALRWVFMVFYIALLVRVIASWIGVGRFGRIERWAGAITEPALRPLRRMLPSIGMIDFSPLVAYFLVRVIESLLLTWV